MWRCVVFSVPGFHERHENRSVLSTPCLDSPSPERELARVLAKANRGMVWTTPTGFRVVHETREPKTQRIATSDRTLIVYQEDETRKIDSRKQADGIVALNRLGIAEQTQRKSMFH